MFTNRSPRLEILSEDAVAVLKRGWTRLMHEFGVRFDHAEALGYFRAAGQDVQGDIVHFDPEFVGQMVALAPAEFDLVSRNPERNVIIGGNHMVFCSMQGPPFVREGSARRPATLADHVNFCKLAQMAPQLDVGGGIICEPQDINHATGHLDLQYNSITLSDKPYKGSPISRMAARDTVAMAAIVAGGRTELEKASRFFASVNPVSPMTWDDRMSGAIIEFAAAGQALALSPFLMMGAVSPAALPGAVAQDIAEALAGLCLAQLVRPRTPVMLGGFLTSIDMWNGQPTFGGPESARSLLMFGQLARYLEIPLRAGGGFLTSSPVPDAQAGYESMNTMMNAFLAGANFTLHCAGWLESALTISYEKFAVDLQMLEALIAEFTPIEISDDLLVFDDHVSAGHTGTFLATPWTAEHFRDCFYRPFLSTSENIQTWQANGSQDIAARAGAVWRQMLADYEEPPMDVAVRRELAEFVSRRKEEIEAMLDEDGELVEP